MPKTTSIDEFQAALQTI